MHIPYFYDFRLFPTEIVRGLPKTQMVLIKPKNKSKINYHDFDILFAVVKDI